MRDEKKVALVTGSSRGIGRAIALLLSRHGYEVIIHYGHDQRKALEVQREILESTGKRMIVLGADISDEDEIDKMIAKVMDHFGRIDVLVNNAAIAIDTLFEEKTKQNFQHILDVNLIGTFLLTKKVGEVMLKQKSGVILNVASTNGIDTYYPMGLDYDASKAGVISLTSNLAVQYAPYIRVNAIAPGWTVTDATRDLDCDFRKKEEASILLGRFAEAEEIANVVLFLISDQASYINGTVVRVDGGYHRKG